MTRASWTMMMRATWITPLALLAAACASSGTESAEPAAPARSASGELGDLLSLEDMNGAPMDLGAELAAGRPVVLVFWQSWCQPCLREAPHIAAADRRYDGRIRFVGVVSGPDDSVDEAAVRAVVERLELGYPQVRDRDLALTRHFDVEGTPTIVVLDPDGGIAYQGHEAPESWDAYLPPRAR